MLFSSSNPTRTAAGAGATLAIAIAALFALAGPAATESAGHAEAPAHEAAAPEPAPVRQIFESPKTGTEIERFCSNIADAARDRRYVLQTKELLALQQEVDKRIKVLEEKRAEYEDWLKRREEFLAQAEDGVVKIYGGMRPDAAAERLAELDATLAAGILMKLDARKAGVILNEMERKAAAMLTGVMASAARRNDPT
ncbi:MAG: MotE family protein [Alphaproteobacteria bacterium]|nr:MotE family protein [Alphaproteobacteria bacterium]MBU0803248.1 MotE family protein [Alphaproteobacteria bacterium]MBU0870772.1 MotE family protein [Alphaproteobacteria bacterium]MBU1403790.1 MotE family protein [Alphaproteobacteria bacterium]MBU1589625.1 MotE family protein [Alphaproteobacteria bacterium]